MSFRTKHKKKREYKARRSSLSNETEGYFPHVFNRYGDRITKATKATHFYRDTRRIHPDIKDEPEVKLDIPNIDGMCQIFGEIDGWPGMYWLDLSSKTKDARSTDEIQIESKELLEQSQPLREAITDLDEEVNQLKNQKNLNKKAKDHLETVEEILTASRTKLFEMYDRLIAINRARIYRILNTVQQTTQITVVNGDTIDVVFQLRQEGLNPVVLNMASAWTPGGGWRKGARAQEESLFYRSTMAISLENCMDLDRERAWRYPLPEYGAVYSPDVFIFRGNVKEKYGIYRWKDCFWLDFMAVAAVRKPKLTHSNQLQQKDGETMWTKIDGMFKIALDKGHDSLVLGAFGCGAYGNPPEDVAQIFKSVMHQYLGCFKRITFAILDDHNAHQKHNPHGNLSVFRRVFAE
jgi:uncharacterized protein (TIGR02452 family)